MGVKQLNRSVNAYFKKRNKITLSNWKIIRGHLKDAQNEIIQKLRGLSITEWQVVNLRSVLSSLDSTIQKFDALFKQQLAIGQTESIEQGLKQAELNAKFGNLKRPITRVTATELLISLKPLSKTLAEFFTGDMLRIINSEVSLGILRQDSVNQVAKNIADKFGIDTERRKALTEVKNDLKRDFKKGSIGKSTFDKKIKTINKQLQKGSAMSLARAERIAMTEMLRADSFAQHEYSLQLAKINPDAVKVWLNAHLPGARRTHLDAEDEYRANPISVKDPFIVAGEAGMFPRDPSFSAANSVNCHCTSVTVSESIISDIGGLQIA